ncbi:MAG: cation transporter [Clostridia bacterium]|nr:cation transporter [Clostridia bacterium]
MDRFKSIKLASVLGIIANIFLMIIKGIIGFITNSQAMIADCFNSAGDIFSSFMTFIGNKIASKPYDDDHNLGHGKAEYIYSMLISIVMGAMAAIVLKDSIISIFKKTNYEFSIWLIVVCIVTILVKLSLFIYTNKISKKLDNLLLEANSKDHRNDCVVTTLNLISCLLSLAGISFVDGIVGTGIAVWIIITAIDIFKESYDVLMDKSINDDTKNKVFEIINRNQEIKKVTHFNSTPVGYRYQISFSIFVDGNLSTFESHKIADDLEKEIAREIKQVYLSVIHVNPI